MTRDILTISAIEIDIKYVFSLLNRIVIVIWSQLSSNILYDIMIYKNHFSRRKEELKFFDNSMIFLEEESVKLKLNLEEIKVLNEWRIK